MFIHPITIEAKRKAGTVEQLAAKIPDMVSGGDGVGHLVPGFCATAGN